MTTSGGVEVVEEQPVNTPEDPAWIALASSDSSSDNLDETDVTGDDGQSDAVDTSETADVDSVMSDIGALVNLV